MKCPYKDFQNVPASYLQVLFLQSCYLDSICQKQVSTMSGEFLGKLQKVENVVRKAQREGFSFSGLVNSTPYRFLILVLESDFLLGWLASERSFLSVKPLNTCVVSLYETLVHVSKYRLPCDLFRLKPVCHHIFFIVN